MKTVSHMDFRKRRSGEKGVEEGGEQILMVFLYGFS